LEFDIAVPLGATRAAADYGVIVSLTLELESITGRSKEKD